MNIDVLVVGGGPAGCAATASLALQGASVLLISRPARHPRRSESLPAQAARVLADVGLAPMDGLVQNVCGGTLSAWGSGHLSAADGLGSPGGPGWFVDRATFDAELRRRCAAAGATVRTDRVLLVSRSGRHWRAELSSGCAVSARWLIDASGRAAIVAKHSGAIRYHDVSLAAVHASRSLCLHETVPSRVLIESTPEGWCYLGAGSGRDVGAAMVVRPHEARALLSPERFAAQLMMSRHVRGWVGAFEDWSPPKAVAAGGSWLHPIHGEGWIACGDAAAAFDPLSAQGLIGALAGGVAAAKAVGAQDTAAAFAALTARHRDIRRIYASRRATAYAREQRWPRHAFWRSQEDQTNTTAIA